MLMDWASLKVFKNVWMWLLGTWFSDAYGSAVLAVGLDDPGAFPNLTIL